jgi:hypothetical protein
MCGTMCFARACCAECAVANGLCARTVRCAQDKARCAQCAVVRSASCAVCRARRVCLAACRAAWKRAPRPLHPRGHCAAARAATQPGALACGVVLPAQTQTCTALLTDGETASELTEWRVVLGCADRGAERAAARARRPVPAAGARRAAARRRRQLVRLAHLPVAAWLACVHANNSKRGTFGGMIRRGLSHAHFCSGALRATWDEWEAQS